MRADKVAHGVERQIAGFNYFVNGKAIAKALLNPCPFKSKTRLIPVQRGWFHAGVRTALEP